MNSFSNGGDDDEIKIPDQPQKPSVPNPNAQGNKDKDLEDSRAYTQAYSENQGKKQRGGYGLEREYFQYNQGEPEDQWEENKASDRGQGQAEEDFKSLSEQKLSSGPVQTASGRNRRGAKITKTRGRRSTH